MGNIQIFKDHIRLYRWALKPVFISFWLQKKTTTRDNKKNSIIICVKTLSKA